jgi:UPF0716 protein FxsA
LLVLLILLLYAAAEVLAFIEVAHQIGILLALLILVVVSAAGPAIVRRVGFGVLAHARARLDAGEPPTREVLDGVLVLIGGVLICIPGFIGDALGLLLMLGPVRRVVIGFAGHRISRRVGRVSFRRGGIVDTTSSAPHWSPPTSGDRELGP